MVNKLTFDGKLALTDLEVGALERMLASGDRGAFHYSYYRMSGTIDSLLTAKIATFSDIVGGAAYAANWYLAEKFGQNGYSTDLGRPLYPGIYALSQDVATKILQQIVVDRDSDGGSGFLNDDQHFQAAFDAWNEAQIPEQFPGLFVDGAKPFFDGGTGATLSDFLNQVDPQPGITASRFGLYFAETTGKKLSDFQGQPGFTTIENGNSSIVIDSTGRVIGVFNKVPTADDLLSIAGNIASRAYNEPFIGDPTFDIELRESLMSGLISGDFSRRVEKDGDLPEIVSARRGFSEFSGTYNGDPDPLLSYDFPGSVPALGFRAAATSNDDILTSPVGGGQINAGAGDDLIFGDAGIDVMGVLAGGEDTIDGGAGNDIIWGFGGNDVLRGGDGDDVVRGGSGNDEIEDTSGENALEGGEGHDTINGGTDIDTVIGGTGADIIEGSAGDDIIDGGEGADVIRYVSGQDQLKGGTGNDYYDFTEATEYAATVVLSAGFGHDTFSENFNYVDTVVFEGLNSTDVWLEWDHITYRGGPFNGRFFMDGAAVIRTINGDSLYLPNVSGQYALTNIGFEFPSISNYFNLQFEDGLRTNWWPLFGLPWELDAVELDDTEGTALDDHERERSRPDDGNSSAENPVNGNNSAENLTGTDLRDVVFTRGGADTVNAGLGNDRIVMADGAETVDGGADLDTVDYSNAINTVEIDLSLGTGSGGLAEGDTFINVEDVIGGAGDDVIIGTDGLNVLKGGDGNDELFGGAGDDWIYGEDGDDRLYGEDGQDRLFGGAGDDYLTGGSDGSLDYYYGGAGNDFLNSRSGSSFMYGGDGDDILAGDDGTDVMFGEDGNDTFRLSLGDDLIFGGLGNDTLSNANGLEVFDTVTIDLAAGTASGITIGMANEIYDIENYIGGREKDIVTGSTGANVINGGGGDDVLAGNAGDDHLIGSFQNDQLFGNAGDDRLAGGQGNDKISGGDGIDTVVLDGSFAEYSFSSSGDSLFLTNGAGDVDQILTDVEFFEFDDVTYALADLPDSPINSPPVATGDVFSVIEGETASGNILGNDTDANGHSLSVISFNGTPLTSLRSGSIGFDFDYDIAPDGLFSFSINEDYENLAAGETTVLSIDYVISDGNGGTDSATIQINITGKAVSNGTLEGTSQDDLIDDAYIDQDGDTVLNSGQEIFGYGGNDTIFAGAGDDIILGNNGDDIVRGGAGNDIIDGGSGQNQLFGEFGDDVFLGLTNQSSADGGEGSDTLDLSGSNTQADVDLAAGTYQSGASVALVISVENVTGTDATNFLFGDDNNNIIEGGRGIDSLTGRGGSDTFRFSTFDGQDLISDFDPSSDVLEVNGVVIHDLLNLPSGVTGQASGINYRLIYGSGDSVVLRSNPDLQNAYPTLFGKTDDLALSVAAFDGVKLDPISLTGAFTVESWVYFTPGTSITNRDGIVSSSNGIAQDINFAGGQMRLYSNDGVGSVDKVIANTQSTAGKWDHYAITRDAAGNLKIYINGVLDAQSSAAFLGEFSIGKLGQTAAGISHALFDNVRIWSVERSEVDIANTMNSGVDPVSAGLERSYIFDDNNAFLVDETGKSADVVLPIGVSMATSTAPVTDYIAAAPSIDGTGGNDTINQAFVDADGDSINDSGQIIYGNDGKDRIYDGAGDDQIYGGGSRDIFYVGAGADAIDGGGHSGDEVFYTRSAVGLTFNLANTALSTGIAQGDSYISIERFSGTQQNDIFFSGSGIGWLKGLGGDDIFYDDVGYNRFSGGGGTDTFVFMAGDGHQDRISDFTIGEDIIDLSDWGVLQFEDLSIYERTANGGAPTGTLGIDFGSEKLRLDGLSASDIPGLDAASFIFATGSSGPQTSQTIDGTFGNDRINLSFVDADGESINDSGQTILGGAGKDTIYDGAGDDLVFGGSGRDIFIAGAGADAYDGGTHAGDQLKYANSASGLVIDLTDSSNSTGLALGDTITSVEKIYGSRHDDTIITGSGATRIYGDRGNDTLIDGALIEFLYGGSGADTFVFSAGDGGRDRVMDFEIGTDQIDLSAWGVTSLTELAFVERTDSAGPQGDLYVNYSNESIWLEGFDANDIGSFTADDFIFA